MNDPHGIFLMTFDLFRNHFLGVLFLNILLASLLAGFAFPIIFEELPYHFALTIFFAVMFIHSIFSFFFFYNRETKEQSYITNIGLSWKICLNSFFLLFPIGLCWGIIENIINNKYDISSYYLFTIALSIGLYQIKNIRVHLSKKII